MVQAASTVLIGIGVSLYFSVKLTLVATISVPIVLLACYYESKYVHNFQVRCIHTSNFLAAQIYSNKCAQGKRGNGGQLQNGR